MSEVAAFAALAERLADAARPITLAYFRAGVAYDVKADTSPVTVADREAEAVDAAADRRGLPGPRHPR